MTQVDVSVDRDALEVTVTAVFKATPERLWQVHTDPKEIVKWWSDTKIEAFELKVGGKWKFVSKGWGGGESVTEGEFKELDEPKKIVRTFEHAMMPGHGMLETTTFEAVGDGTTRQTSISKFKSLDDLDKMAPAMEKGAREGMQVFAKVVEQ